jgi:hypothetical protein
MAGLWEKSVMSAAGTNVTINYTLCTLLYRESVPEFCFISKF